MHGIEIIPKHVAKGNCKNEITQKQILKLYCFQPNILKSNLAMTHLENIYDLIDQRKICMRIPVDKNSNNLPNMTKLIIALPGILDTRRQREKSMPYKLAGGDDRLL